MNEGVILVTQFRTVFSKPSWGQVIAYLFQNLDVILSYVCTVWVTGNTLIFLVDFEEVYFLYLYLEVEFCTRYLSFWLAAYSPSEIPKLVATACLPLILLISQCSALSLGSSN